MNLFIDSKLKDFNLNANEACVYSAIAAVSKGKGWFVSYESLANHLPVVISTKTVERAIKRLTDLGLIERRQNALFATTNCLPPVDKLSATRRQIVTDKSTNCPLETDKLTPIYNKENKEKREESHSPSLFDQLVSAYKAQNPNTNPSPKILDASRRLWDDLAEYKQKQILEAVQSGFWNKDNLEWIISDFKFREPINYAGLSAPRGVDLYRVPIAPNKFAIYTAEDVKEFNIANAEFYMKTCL